MELLENRVQELTTTNKALEQDNESLMARVNQLEARLRQLSSVNQGIPAGLGLGGPVPSANAFLAASSAERLAPGGMMNPMAAVDFDLQRRAAMVGLGGATTGLGGGLPGPSPAEAMRYFQLMQFKNPAAAAAAVNGPGMASVEHRF
jgi:hypothetical protein